MKRKEREWMYNRFDHNRILRNEFVDGVSEFVSFAQQHPELEDKIRCPCAKCKNWKFFDEETVKVHLFKKGFIENYYEWFCHGETGSTSSPTEPNPYREMVVDAFGNVDQSFREEAGSAEEEPNAEAKMFFEMLKAAEQPLYDGSSISVLEMASRMINLKSEYNLPHRNMAPKKRVVSKGRGQSVSTSQDDDAHSSTPAHDQPQPLATMHPSASTSAMRPTGSTSAMRPTGSTSALRPGELSRHVDMTRRRTDDGAVRHLQFGALSSQPQFGAPSFQPRFEAPRFEAPRFPAPSFVSQTPVPDFGPFRPQAAPLSQPATTPATQQVPTPATQPTPTPVTQPTPTPTTGEASTSTTPCRRKLDPSGIWFGNQDVVRSITATIKNYFQQPWRNYSEVDEATKDHWWKMWKKLYTWRPELEGTVKKAYEEKAAIRLKDNFYKLVQLTDAPVWLGDEMLQKMKDKAKDPKGKKKSVQAKTNRRCGNASGPAPPSHCGGSVSTIHRVNQWEKKEGKRPTISELFLDTHFNKAPGREPQPVSSKAKEVMEKYTQNLSESQASGSPSDPNEVFFDTVGGYWKGEVLGFGKHGASLYYEKRPRRHGDSGYYSPSVSAKLTQMSEELERTKAELAETNREREEEHRRMVEKQAQQDAKQAQQDAYIQQMKAQMDLLMRRFGDQPPGPGRFPDDRTDGSGGSGSFPVVS